MAPFSLSNLYKGLSNMFYVICSQSLVLCSTLHRPSDHCSWVSSMSYFYHISCIVLAFFFSLSIKACSQYAFFFILLILLFRVYCLLFLAFGHYFAPHAIPSCFSYSTYSKDYYYALPSFVLWRTCSFYVALRMVDMVIVIIAIIMIIIFIIIMIVAGSSCSNSSSTSNSIIIPSLLELFLSLLLLYC